MAKSRNTPMEPRRRGRRPKNPYSPRLKRRSVQQIMEEESMVAIRMATPKAWVMHQYSPDYGVDFVVEVFKLVGEKKRSFETLSELYFVQAESLESTQVQKLNVKSRINVELSPFSPTE